MSTTMHPRVSVSAVSTFELSLDEDLAFWARHHIDAVGVSVAKLERFGWVDGTRLVADAVARGLRVANLIGLGPFHLADPTQWTQQQERLLHTLDTAVVVGAECMVFTTGPFAPLSWEEAADALHTALRPVLATARERNIPFAIEHTNSLRVDVGFVHTLRDAIDLARRLDIGVCMELNACWAERGLADTIRSGADRIRLVQVSDFKVGTIASSQRLVPGDGDMPIARILRHVVDAGYAGVFDLELIGAAITSEGYDLAVPRAVDALGALLTELGA
jgi:sugar phosphate isomerase/epimerase